MEHAGAGLAAAGLLWWSALGGGPVADSQCSAGPAAAAHCAALATQEPTQWLFGEALDLNRAAASSLESLPGIGPARAAAIVGERCRGRFERVEDIERVRGIGPGLRARIAARVAVGIGPVPGCPDASPSASPSARVE